LPKKLQCKQNRGKTASVFLLSFDLRTSSGSEVAIRLTHNSNLKDLIPACAGSTVVEHLSHDSNLEGSIPAGVGSARDKITKKF